MCVIPSFLLCIFKKNHFIFINLQKGANAIEDERGRILFLSNLSEEERIAKAQLLRTFTEKSAKHSIKKVHRHLRTGDVILLNRQPTLHKPR
jgi:DNA-directed RNA polymerase I subunit RPA1